MEALPANRAGIFTSPNTLTFPAGHDRAKTNLFLEHKESLHRFWQSQGEESILQAQHAEVCRLRLTGNFKFEVQRGNFISGVIVRIRQLRHAIEQLVFAWRPLINAGEKINQMSPGFACRPECDYDVAL
jgi:hypothetical protein